MLFSSKLVSLTRQWQKYSRPAVLNLDVISMAMRNYLTGKSYIFIFRSPDKACLSHTSNLITLLWVICTKRHNLQGRGGEHGLGINIFYRVSILLSINQTILKPQSIGRSPVLSDWCCTIELVAIIINLGSFNNGLKLKSGECLCKFYTCG